MNIQFQLFTAFWMFPLFAMQLAAQEMFVVKPPKLALIVIQGGKSR
jgi:hypothetical protein